MPVVVKVCMSKIHVIVLHYNGMLPVVSPLVVAPGFNMVDSIKIDYMHVVCLGSLRSLLDVWLNGQSEPYFIGDKI
jgi:hypothetical protein